MKGIEAGAGRFSSKPMNQPELLRARVRFRCRVKQLQDELASLNRDLEERVREQVAQVDRLGRLKRFFSPQLAEAIVTGRSGRPAQDATGGRSTVVFSTSAGSPRSRRRPSPRKSMGVLREYHAEMGQLDPRARGHARALHRRRHDDLLQRPRPRARCRRSARSGWRWPCASGSAS